MKKEIKDGMVAHFAPMCLGLEMSAREMLERDERILGPEAIDHWAQYIDFAARRGKRIIFHDPVQPTSMAAERFGTERFWTTLHAVIIFEVGKVEAKHKNWDPSVHTEQENKAHEEWERQEQLFFMRMGVHEIMGQVKEGTERISNG
jgi:hypothetical protein